MALGAVLFTVLSAGCADSAPMQNPLVGRWRVSRDQPTPAGTLARVDTTVEFTASGGLNVTIAGVSACMGTITVSDYQVTVNATSATAGTYLPAVLGTCSGGPVQCPSFGTLRDIESCSMSPMITMLTTGSPFLLSADRRSLSLNTLVFTRVP